MKAACLKNNIVVNIIDIPDGTPINHPMIEDIKRDLGYESIELVDDKKFIDIGLEKKGGDFEKPADVIQKELDDALKASLFYVPLLTEDPVFVPPQERDKAPMYLNPKTGIIRVFLNEAWQNLGEAPK